MIKVGIVGGAGYVGGELIRLLVNHPDTQLSFVQSESQAGKSIQAVHQDIFNKELPHFSDSISDNVDVIFLCSGHGLSNIFLQKNEIRNTTKVIDLSADFRLKNSNHTFEYGLPEVYKEAYQNTNHIANPGCFATSIQLALLPLAANNLLQNDVHVHAITGSTGAGQSLTPTSHFSWRNNNISVYKAFEHQHLAEISQTLNHLQEAKVGELHFIPVRGDFTRGIFTTAYTSISADLHTCIEMYQAFYIDSPFVHISKENIHLKQVVNTNNGILHLEKHGDKLLIVSIIDNLLKGAAGQAVQNMNLLFGLEESAGLRLKATFF